MGTRAPFRQIRYTAVTGPEFRNTNILARLHTLHPFHTIAAILSLLLSQAHQMVVRDGSRMG